MLWKCRVWCYANCPLSSETVRETLPKANCPLSSETVRETLPNVMVIAVGVEQSSFVQWPKVAWLLNCALASVTAKTSQLCGLRTERGGSRNEGVRNLQGSLHCTNWGTDFWIILGKLKQEWRASRSEGIHNPFL